MAKIKVIKSGKETAKPQTFARGWWIGQVDASVRLKVSRRVAEKSNESAEYRTRLGGDR